MSNSDVEIKIYQTLSDLERQKKVFNTINKSLLPDKGEKLKNRISELENLLKDLNIAKSDADKLINEHDSEHASEDRLNNVKKVEEKPSFLSNDLKSFEDLKKESAKDSKEHISDKFDSPSFKSYRKTELIPRTKLTEAKPLFEICAKKNSKIFSSVKYCPITDEDAKQLHEKLSLLPEDCEKESPPKDLEAKLMDHQMKALTWLKWRESQNPSGGILADDMGLGKTLTMIALIIKQRKTIDSKSISEKNSTDMTTKGTLIVCLASIIKQWESEIDKHCKKNSVNVLLFHGPKREKDVFHVQKFDVVLTTYQTLMSENKSKKAGKDSPIYKLKWDRIILDEAHTIKNHSSQTAEAVFSLSGLKKWCVTGTPIHNNFKDMYSLIKFLQLHPLDDYKKFKKLIDDDSDSTAERRNLLVKSILLRHTKDECDDSGKPLIKDIKEKSIKVISIDLSEEERKAYDELYLKVKEIVNKIVTKSSRKLHDSSSLLVLLLRLQQVCSHMSLLKQETNMSLLKQETKETVDDSVDDLTHNLSLLDIDSSDSSSSSLNLSLNDLEKNSMYDSTVKSSKMKKLFEILELISKDTNNTAKSVIVSQWVSMLELIEKHLKKENKSYHIIVGNTKTDDRQRMSEDFNCNKDGCKIMLLSLRAGGVGLNLIGATHLFLLDLHWNPALEMQACDRIHRVGQKNDVTIHKFVCKGTIEEKILETQEEKSNLAKGVLHGAIKMKKGLSLDDFKALFNLK